MNVARELIAIAKLLVSKPTFKQYNVQQGIGKSKYVVNFHDGVKTHKDGSPFFDVRIFKNKNEMESFLNELGTKGYKKHS